MGMVTDPDFFYVNLDDIPDEAPPCTFCLKDGKKTKAVKVFDGVALCKLHMGFD